MYLAVSTRAAVADGSPDQPPKSVGGSDGARHRSALARPKLVPDLPEQEADDEHHQDNRKLEQPAGRVSRGAKKSVPGEVEDSLGHRHADKDERGGEEQAARDADPLIRFHADASYRRGIATAIAPNSPLWKSTVTTKIVLSALSNQRRAQAAVLSEVTPTRVP